MLAFQPLAHNRICALAVLLASAELVHQPYPSANQCIAARRHPMAHSLFLTQTVKFGLEVKNIIYYNNLQGAFSERQFHFRNVKEKIVVR